MALFQQLATTLLLIAATSGICLGQLPSLLSQDGSAKALQVDGQVSVLRDSGPWAVQAGQLIPVKHIIVTGESGYAVFQVADGSTFEVFPNSRVTFRANSGNWKDLLDLWLGRVRVHIQRLSGQPNHNRILTPTAVISVRGTIFNVSVEDENSTLVAVEEGLVAVQHALLPAKEPKLVNPGESIRVYHDQPLAKAGPNRDAAIQHGLRAAAEAIYRLLYRTPTPSAGGGIPTGSGGGAPLPGDTETTPPPPPPPN